MRIPQVIRIDFNQVSTRVNNEVLGIKLEIINQGSNKEIGHTRIEVTTMVKGRDLIRIRETIRGIRVRVQAGMQVRPTGVTQIGFRSHPA